MPTWIKDWGGTIFTELLVGGGCTYSVGRSITACGFTFNWRLTNASSLLKRSFSLTSSMSTCCSSKKRSLAIVPFCSSPCKEFIWSVSFCAFFSYCDLIFSTCLGSGLLVGGTGAFSSYTTRFPVIEGEKPVCGGNGLDLTTGAPCAHLFKMVEAVGIFTGGSGLTAG